VSLGGGIGGGVFVGGTGVPVGSGVFVGHEVGSGVPLGCGLGSGVSVGLGVGTAVAVGHRIGTGVLVGPSIAVEDPTYTSRMASATTSWPAVAPSFTATEPCPARSYVPSRFHCPPLTLWLTLTVEEPARCRMMYGTLPGRRSSAHHQA
jgi:hypothetical protein